ncbi:hypothetical protein [Niabella hibiscisoli]|uniref:hypothetical protein n=1 Tax=Niabella hibiscisoli TaxID=1825928 RepID=UPI001F0D2E73|nr:hypothetical protein [Niabella hibiscisoli]MCH5718411.1 hypothetical protein [Niabella hibiscisoli]
MGKSYGEIAAESRSQHKSQGFGSAATRGDSYEYFKTTGGDAPKNDLFDGVNISWNRVGKNGQAIEKMIAAIESKFDITAPEKSVTQLVALYKLLGQSGTHYWIEKRKQKCNS